MSRRDEAAKALGARHVAQKPGNETSASGVVRVLQSQAIPLRSGPLTKPINVVENDEIQAVNES